MKLLAYAVTALATLPGAIAVDQRKSAIIWFEDLSTPDHVVNRVREAIVKAGGKITHSYSIITGFAVIAPEKALEIVQAMDIGHPIKVEQDEIVSTN